MIHKKTYHLERIFPTEVTEYLNFIKVKVQSKLVSLCFNLPKFNKLIRISKLALVEIKEDINQ